MTDEIALIQYITRIRFGAGSLACLNEELSGLGIHAPLVITDRGFAQSGVLQTVLDALGAGGAVPVFDGTAENPSEANLRDALHLLKSKGSDGLIALGGGSALDLGKAVALLATHGGVFSDYEIKNNGSEAIGRECPVLPHIAIPTAAGTGAEIGRAAVLTLDDGRKSVAVNLKIVANTILSDPVLTLSLPPRLTAATGIDALTHGIEAFLSLRYNPPADALAIDSIRRIAGHIEHAYADGQKIKHRTEMMMGALLGGMVLQKGLGALHAMSNPLGELGLHHGTINAVLLPHLLRFNADNGRRSYAPIRVALNLDSDADLAGWAAALVRRLGLPTSLAELGVAEDALPAIAEKAASDHLSATNPRPAGTKEYLRLLKAAFRGQGE